MQKKIVGATESVKLTKTNQLERWAVYQYTLDGLGPFTHEVRVTEDTPEKLKEAMAAKERVLQEAQS